VTVEQGAVECEAGEGLAVGMRGEFGQTCLAAFTESRQSAFTESYGSCPYEELLAFGIL